MNQTKPANAILGLWILAASLSAFAQTAPAPSQTGNAVNGMNSYPSPSAIRYAPFRDLVDRRIDSFIGDWHESMPRYIHGSLVVRDILTKNDNFAPPFRAAFLQYANCLSYATLAAHASTVPSRLQGQQEIYYFISGSGKISGAGTTAPLHKDIAVFVPANLEFTMENTGDQPIHMYIINEPTPPEFKPRDKMVVVDERAAHVRTPALVAYYASGIGVQANTAPTRPDPYIVPGASGHWAHVVRELFATRDGLGALSSVITVELQPVSMGEPHPHQPGHEEIWLALEGDSLAMMGSEVRMQHPGMAYMVRPDGQMVHSNINFSDHTVKFLFFVNRGQAPIRP